MFSESSSERDKNDFMNELNILKKVGQHPNVVCLVGACHIQGFYFSPIAFHSESVVLEDFYRTEHHDVTLKESDMLLCIYFSAVTF